MKRLLIILSSVVFGLVLGVYFSPLLSTDSIYEQIKKIDKVLNIAARNYLEPVDTQKLTEAAIKGMLNELDVHSVYIPADEMQRVNEDFQGSFEGIGIEFDVINDTIVVVSPIPGGPSEALGIRSGDKIVKIDGNNAVGMSRNEVPKKLRGPKGTIVEIDVKREGTKDLLHFKIKRDKIPLNTVDAAFMVDGTDVGVVVINRFAATTNDELRSALDKLSKMGMKKLILDLRGNPGGYLNQAFLVAEEFIKRGDTIVYTKGRLREFDDVYISSGNQPYVNLPLIVLINEGSASASEIVAGAIQDLDRGLIVGETSFGKGLVQRQYELGDGSAFRLTIAKYYTPSGRCIQRPYKDKDKYRHLVGRLELEEGSYIYDAYNKIISQVKKINDTTKNESQKINIDSLPIYRTRSGRVVFGGGGITPDYIIKSDTITKMTYNIRRENLFFEFIDKTLMNEVERVKKAYSNFKDYYRNYVISEPTLNDFRSFVEKKGIKVEPKDWETDKAYISTYLKAQIARIVWTREQFLEVLFTQDNQFKKALELFPEAIKIANLKVR